MNLTENYFYPLRNKSEFVNKKVIYPKRAKWAKKETYGDKNI